MKNTFPALTGIRQIAAFMVVIHHMVRAANFPWLHNLIKEFSAGVTIFFVLSGFLISYRYYDDYKESFVWKKSYVINRVARIYPVYFLVTICTFIIIYFTNHDHSDFLRTFLLNITFLRGFSEHYIYSGLAQGWTLTVEEVFYFIAPLMFFFSRKIPLLLQTCLFVAIGFLAIVLTGLGSTTFMLICTFFGRSFEFICGIYLYRILKSDSFKGKNVTIIAGIGVMLLVVLMSLLSYSPYQYGIQNPFGIVVNNLLMPVVIAGLFWGLIKEKTLLQRFLSTKLMQVLGKSSYTLYLIHYSFFSYLIQKYISSNTIIVIIIIQVAAILIWHFVEEPLNLSIRSHFRSHPPSVAKPGTLSV